MKITLGPSLVVFGATLGLLGALVTFDVYADQSQTPPWLPDIQNFNSLFANGKAGAAIALIPSIHAKLSESSPLDQIAVYNRIEDLCISVYEFPCITEVESKRWPNVKKLFDDVETKSERKFALAADGSERAMRYYLATNNQTRIKEDIESLEKSVPDPFKIEDFDRANLTIALAAVRLGDIPKAAFYARRGWLHFISAKKVDPYRFASLIPDYIQVFLAIGDIKRATAIAAITRPALIQLGDQNAYLMLKLANTIANISNFTNEPAVIVSASNVALSLIKRVELNDTVRDFYEMQAISQSVIVCSLVPVNGCDLQTAVPRLAELVETFYAMPLAREDYSLRIAAVAIAMHSAKFGNPVPATARLICLMEPSKDADSTMEAERSAYWSGRYFLATVDRSGNRDEFIVSAAKNEIARLRHFLVKQPFETAPIGYYSRVILMLAGYRIAEKAEKAEKTTEDTELLLEIASLVNRSARSVETQYVQILSEMSTDTDAAALQALHRLEQSRFLAEKSALRELPTPSWGGEVINPFAPDSFDAQRWRVLTEYAQMASRHDNVKKTASKSFDGKWNLLGDLRLTLKPNERFITHFVAFDKIVRICISKNDLVTGAEHFDFSNSVVTQKTIQAALTNPGPPSPEVDSTFPIAEARKLSELLLGRDGHCVGNATHLLFATDPGLQSIPLHVLLDPGNNSIDVGPGSLASVPWLGVTRAISIVVDAQELISSRRLRVLKSPPPFAFLGIGDPHLDGVTQDGQPRSEVALRGAKRGAAPSLSQLNPLPETRQEIQSMTTIFGQDSRALLGDDASESNVRRQLLSNYRVISFATHGLLREEIEGIIEPALVLTPIDSMAETDNGVLTATEIADLSLNADLVILSACNSASFDLQLFGPEAASLSTAFFLAGAKSTLASLWSVDSEATAELMNVFGAELKSNPNAGAAEALHKAIGKFMKSASNPNYRNPRFWAAFTLYGDGGSTGPKLSSPPPSLVLRELYQTAVPVMGEFIFANPVAANKTLLAGYMESGKPRVTGQLRLIQHDKVLWDVTDPDYSFIPLRRSTAGIPPVLAWNWVDGTFYGQIRWYSDQGVLDRTQTIPALKDGMVEDYVSIGSGKMVIAYRLNGTESYDVILRQLDQKGIVQVERRFPFSAASGIEDVRLFPGSRGLWLSVTVRDSTRVGKTFFSNLGSLKICHAYQTQLSLLNETLGDANDFRQINDMRINDVVPEGNDTDVAAVTTYDPCDAFTISNAAIAMIRPGDKSTLHPMPFVGFSTEATKLLKRKEGNWTLVGTVRRELSPFNPGATDWTDNDNLRRWRRSGESGRHRGLVVVDFSPDKTFKTPRMFFTGASLFAMNAVPLDNSDILFVGGNNLAQFVGTLGR